MKYCFGVDVGGTTVKLGLFTVEGELLDKWEIKTYTENEGERILPDVTKAIKEKIAEKKLAADEICGIGVGVPAPVDKNGAIERAANVGWKAKEIKKELEELTGYPCVIGNDANVAALGELWKGGALLVMIDLAGHRGGLVPGRQIAERLELSQKYLERILRTLAEAGLIEGSHGKGGGYRLLRSPADYTAGEILRAAEGTLACLGEDVQLTPAETASGVSEVYRRLDAQIRAALDAVTLSSLTAADAGDEYVI